MSNAEIAAAAGPLDADGRPPRVRDPAEARHVEPARGHRPHRCPGPRRGRRTLTELPGNRRGEHRVSRLSAPPVRAPHDRERLDHDPAHPTARPAAARARVRPQRRPTTRPSAPSCVRRTASSRGPCRAVFRPYEADLLDLETHARHGTLVVAEAAASIFGWAPSTATATCRASAGRAAGPAGAAWPSTRAARARRGPGPPGRLERRGPRGRRTGLRLPHRDVHGGRGAALRAPGLPTRPAVRRRPGRSTTAITGLPRSRFSPTGATFPNTSPTSRRRADERLPSFHHSTAHH